MKKIVIMVAILFNFALSSDFNEHYLEKYKNTQKLMTNMKINFPTLYNVISDYFKAKTCKNNIVELVSINEIRNFTTTVQFGFLLNLKYRADSGDKMANDKYSSLISDYKFMNCGTKK